MLCPRCGDRKTKLFITPDHEAELACGKCHHLRYRSQQRRKRDVLPQAAEADAREATAAIRELQRIFARLELGQPRAEAARGTVRSLEHLAYKLAQIRQAER